MSPPKLIGGFICELIRSFTRAQRAVAGEISFFNKQEATISLFDVFTGEPAKKAAEQTRSYLTGVQNNGENTINTGLNNATNYLGFNSDQARSIYGDAYNTGRGDVNSGTDGALGYATNGINTANGYYDAATAPLSSLGSKYGGATTMGLNALGVNGQAGTDAARSAFTAGPAYNFNMEQGLDAINRRRTAGGMLDSGNADRDAQKFGAGLASNEYDKWIGNLLGFTNPELGATGAYANVKAGQAGTNNSNAQTQAQYANSRGGMLADLASRYGTNTGGSYANEGQSLANLYTGAAGQQVGLATGLAQPYTSTYKNEADAEMAGSGNLWKLGIAAASLGAGGLGGAAAGGASSAFQGLQGGGYYQGGNLAQGPGYYGAPQSGGSLNNWLTQVSPLRGY